MQKSKTYTNGQVQYEQKGDVLTYYHKNGKIKATGIFKNDSMEGKWIFYRETGQLWVIGHFKNNRKHGRWIRYDRNDKLESDEEFADNKKVKST